MFRDPRGVADDDPDFVAARNEVDWLRQRLAALPPLSPPRDLWDSIEARVARRERRMRAAHRWGAAAATIAGVALTIGVMLQRDANAVASIEMLIGTSQQLERSFGAMVATSADSSEVGRVLAYRIAAVDAALNQMSAQDRADTAESARLWQQRVALLESMLDLERGAGAPLPMI